MDGIAPVNMFLRITRKREDGFHELASLFQAVSLFDTLDFWTQPVPALWGLRRNEVATLSFFIPGVITMFANIRYIYLTVVRNLHFDCRFSARSKRP